MIRALILDMDGVIIESTEIKNEAFKKLFSKWPHKVDEIMAYHKKNVGISRYVKIRYFYENILNEPYSEEIGEKMAKEFSDMVLQEVKKAPLVPGVQRLLEDNGGRYLIFVASGTPHNELVEILHDRGMEGFFSGCYGSPEAKVDVIQKIIKDHSLRKEEVIFLGDGETDLKAAQATGVHFVLMLTYDNRYLIKQSARIITDFHNLTNLIEKIVKNC